MKKTATSKRLSFMLMVFLSIAMVFTFLNVRTTARADGASPMFLAMFVLFMVLVGGRKGIRSLVRLMVAVFLILAFLIPAIYRGASSVGMGILTAMLITVFSMVLLNGISLKTSVAVVATLVGILAAAVVYYIFAAIFHVSGYNLEGAEELILIRKIKQKNKHSL